MKSHSKNVIYIEGTDIPLAYDEIQTKNRRKREAQAGKIFAYQRFLQSAAHFENVSDLDQRTYLLTVNLKYNCLDTIRKPIFFKLNQVTQKYAFSGGPERPGLFLSDDVGGSRYNKSFNGNHHLHGVLIMPKKQQALNLHSGFVTEVIKQQIGQLVEVSDVDCQAFKYDKPLDYVIGYADKFTRKNAHEAFGAHQFDSVIYPYDIAKDVHGRRDSEKHRLRSNYKRLLDLLYTNPAEFLSEEYMHHFGDGIIHFSKEDNAMPRFIEPATLKIAA